MGANEMGSNEMGFEYVCPTLSKEKTINFMSNDWILIHNPNNQHEWEIWKSY